MKNDVGGGEVDGNGGENRNGGRKDLNLNRRFRPKLLMNLKGWNRAERAGQSICDHVIGARDIDNITCKLREVGKVASLSGGPRRRGTKQS